MGWYNLYYDAFYVLERMNAATVKIIIFIAKAYQDLSLNVFSRDYFEINVFHKRMT